MTAAAGCRRRNRQEAAPQPGTGCSDEHARRRIPGLADHLIAPGADAARGERGGEALGMANAAPRESVSPRGSLVTLDSLNKLWFRISLILTILFDPHPAGASASRYRIALAEKSRRKRMDTCLAVREARARGSSVDS